MNKTDRRFPRAAALVLFGAATMAASAQQAKHVIVFGVDGLSATAVAPVRTPNMSKLMGRGVWTLRARAILPTVSAPNWSAMIMGAAPDLTGVTSNDWFPEKFEIAPVCHDGSNHPPTIFGAVKQAGRAAGLFTDWRGFVRLLEPGAAKIFEKEGDARAVVQKAIADFTAGPPALTFIHVDHVDHAGHESGWYTPAYYEAVQSADAMLGDVLAAVEKTGLAVSTIVLVTSDHGGHDTKHGGMLQSDIVIPWIAAGPGLEANVELAGPISTTGTAPTIAAWLGIAAPRCWVGRVIVNQKSR